jgi:predicted ABC-type ATPase
MQFYILFCYVFIAEVGRELAVRRVKRKVAVCGKHSRFVFGSISGGNVGYSD